MSAWVNYHIKYREVFKDIFSKAFMLNLLLCSIAGISKKVDRDKEEMKRWWWDEVVYIRNVKVRHVVTKNPIHFITNLTTSLWIDLKNKMVWSGIFMSIKAINHSFTNCSPPLIGEMVLLCFKIWVVTCHSHDNGLPLFKNPQVLCLAISHTYNRALIIDLLLSVTQLLLVTLLQLSHYEL